MCDNGKLTIARTLRQRYCSPCKQRATNHTEHPMTRKLGKKQQMALDVIRAGGRVSPAGMQNSEVCCIEDAQRNIVGMISWASMLSLESAGLVTFTMTGRPLDVGHFALAAN